MNLTLFPLYCFLHTYNNQCITNIMFPTSTTCIELSIFSCRSKMISSDFLAINMQGDMSQRSRCGALAFEAKCGAGRLLGDTAHQFRAIAFGFIVLTIMMHAMERLHLPLCVMVAYLILKGFSFLSE